MLPQKKLLGPLSELKLMLCLDLARTKYISTNTKNKTQEPELDFSAREKYDFSIQNHIFQHQQFNVEEEGSEELAHRWNWWRLRLSTARGLQAPPPELEPALDVLGEHVPQLLVGEDLPG